MGPGILETKLKWKLNENALIFIKRDAFEMLSADQWPFHIKLYVLILVAIHASCHVGVIWYG